jgi:hypothetical protein
MSIVQWPQFQRPLDLHSAEDSVGLLHELARWWMTPMARQLADSSRGSDYWAKPPVLPSQIGACWVLTVNPDRRTHELLKPAFLFPLIWVREIPHDPRLPRGLVDLADDVRNTLANEPGVRDGQWGLQIYFESEPWNATPTNRGMDYPDLSQLSRELFDFRSGWVSLAGALWAAVEDKPSNPAVWATGCWSPSSGITEVGGLEQKLELAGECLSAHLGDRMKDAFVVVPSDNLIEANRVHTRQKFKFNIVSFPSPQVEPRLALGRYLALLRVKPLPNAPVDDHVAYYKGLLSDDRSVAEDYYQQVLYPMVVQQCRRSLNSIDPMPTHLVTVVSVNNELVRLAVEVFGIERCLILYTVPTKQSAYTRGITDMSEKAEKAAADCRKLGCQVYPEAFSYDASNAEFRESLGNTFRQLLLRHFGEVTPELIAIDMHGAHKIFNYALEHAAARPGNLLYWIDHKWFPFLQTQLPLTERFVVWRAGSEWTVGPS